MKTGLVDPRGISLLFANFCKVIHNIKPIHVQVSVTQTNQQMSGMVFRMADGTSTVGAAKAKLAEE
jgi:hypothetical protein